MESYRQKNRIEEQKATERELSQLADGLSNNSMSVGGEPTKSASKGKNKGIFGMFRRKSKDEKTKKDDDRTESVT